MLELAHPDFKEIIQGRLDNLEQHAINSPLLREKYLALDGTVLTVEVSATYLSVGRQRLFFVYVHDVTQQVLYEQQLQEANQVLSWQNQHLKQAAYLISHQLRAHSANIQGLIQLYDRQQPDNALNGQLVDGIVTSSQALDLIIRQANDILESQSFPVNSPPGR